MNVTGIIGKAEPDGGILGMSVTAVVTRPYAVRFQTALPYALFLCLWGVSAVGAAVPDGNADIVLGQPDATASYPNAVSSGTFNAPYAVGNYSNNPLFVVDRENSRVLFWRSPLTNLLGNGQPADGVIGQVDFTAGKANRGGAAGANTLNRPCGVYYNSGENAVWVADCGNNRLLRFLNPPNFGASADMVLGQADYASVAANRGGAVAANTLNNPTDVAGDYLSGDIWVADPGNHRIVKYACIYSAGCTFAANASLVVGQDNLNSDYYSSKISSKTVTYFSNDTESGITVDNGGNLWVADTNANRVLKFTTPVANGSSATIVLGQADFNASSSNRGGAVAANTLFKPSQVSVSVDQSVVWVADTHNFRVLKFTAPMASGADASLVLGQLDFTSALSGVANMVPAGVFLPRDGTDLWVTDRGADRLLKFSSPTVNGVSPDRVVGKADLTMSGPNYVESRGLYSPYGMVVDGKRNRVFASDTYNHRVLWWNNPASYATGKAADGVLGQANFYSRQANRGLTTPLANTLAIPGGLALDADGNIWVADAMNNRVLRYNGASLVNGVAAEFVLGQADFVSKGANRGGSAGQNTLSYPTGVGVDSNGDIWVGDSVNNRILKFSGSVLANGANAALVLGQLDFISVSPNQGGVAGQATLSWPSAIRCQNADVWVIDGGNERVLKYAAPAANGAGAGLVLGQTTFSGTSGGCEPNKFWSVGNGVNIDFDAMGNLWVPDQGGNRVLRFEPPFSSNGMAASVVLGQADFTSCGENRGAAVGGNSLKTPYSVAIDPKLNVYVGDVGNNRVMIFNSGLALTELHPSVTDRKGTSLGASWDSIPGANYVAVLSSVSSYSPVISSVALGGNTTTFIGLKVATTYYFEVKLSTEIDAAFHLNRISTATMPDITAPTGAPSVPDAGVLYSTSGNVTFTWTIGTSSDPESGIAGYDLQVGTDSAANDASAFNNDVGNVPARAFTGLAEGTYYARARAKNAYNLPGAFSAWGVPVKVDWTPPAAPTITSPSHPGAPIICLSTAAQFALAAVDAVSGVAGYHYVVDQSSYTPPGAGDAYLAGSSTRTAAALAAGTWYFHAAARDAAGNVGPAAHYRVNIGSAVDPARDNVFDSGESANKVVVSIASGAVSAAAGMVIEARQERAVPPAPRDPTMRDAGVYKEIGLSSGTIHPGRTVTITIAYEAWQVTGLDEDSLRLAYYNPARGRWEIVYDTVIDKTARTLTATVDHFSLWKIVSYTAQAGAVAGVGNYPNPFTAGRGGRTKIHYSLKADSQVVIKIYDLLGKLVWHRVFSPGTAGGSVGVNDVAWDGRNDKGSYVGAGAYICVVKAGGEAGKVKIAVK